MIAIAPLGGHGQQLRALGVGERGVRRAPQNGGEIVRDQIVDEFSLAAGTIAAEQDSAARVNQPETRDVGLPCQLRGPGAEPRIGSGFRRRG